jgi:hypothetical protein
MLKAQLFLVLVVVLAAQEARAGNARLLAMDAAETIDHPVIGLQRTAIPIVGGIAIDTSLFANIALAPNIGLRWAVGFGDHRIALGARYTHFVGSGVYGAFVTSQQHVVKKFEPTFSGPTFYGLYGVKLGPVGLHAEVRYSRLSYDSLSTNGAVAFSVTKEWAVVGELGYRILGLPQLHAAAGLRYTGKNLGLTVGVAYVGFADPMFPQLPVLPAFDLSWSFA